MDDLLPSSGEEYLRMVKAQARSCPAVVIAPKAKEYLSVKNTSQKYQTDWRSCRPAPEGCAPTAEWKEHFMRQFGVDRAKLKRYKQVQGYSTKRKIRRRQPTSEKDSVSGRPDEAPDDVNASRSTASISSLSSIPDSTHVLLPRMYDEQGWRNLLYGEYAPSRRNPGPGMVTATATISQASQSAQTVNAENSETTQESIASAAASALEAESHGAEEQHHGISPHPHFLIRLDQGYLMQLLKYHLRWLAEDDLSDHEAKWLYALFLKLDPLVESDQVAVLRNLAKKCARIRSHFNSESGSKLATVNMIITITARLFGQGDLE